MRGADRCRAAHITGEHAVHPFGRLLAADLAQRHVEMQFRDRFQVGKHTETLTGIGTVQQIRRRANAPGGPVRCHITEGITPFRESALTVVDFLSGADQADDRTEPVMPADCFEQMRGFGAGERHRLVARLRDRPAGGPAALRLVDHHDALGWRVRGVGEVMVPESGQRLDRALHLAGSIAAPGTEGNGIAGQRLAQHMHEGGIAGEIGAAAGILGAEDGVEPTQGLAGAGNAGDEQDHAAVLAARYLDLGQDRVGGGAQVACVAARGAEVGDAMLRVEHAGGIDDARHRVIGRREPGIGVERAREQREVSVQRAQKSRQGLHARVERRRDAVAQCERQRCGGNRRVLGHQDRHDGRSARAGVEIVEVDRVILDLAAIGEGVRHRARLDLQHQNCTAGEQDHVRPAAEAEHRIFEQNAPTSRFGKGREGRPQHGDGRLPGPELLRLVQAEMAELRGGEHPDDGGGRRAQEVTRGAGPEGGHRRVAVAPPARISCRSAPST